MSNNKETLRPRLQIIRGLPGSGKTTLAVQRYSHLLRLETDMYFSREGKYVFTMDLNKRAVKWFNSAVRRTASTKMDFVLTGVFAAHTERLERAIRMGLDNGYDVWVKTLTKNYGNIHGVPKEHFDSMQKAFVSERVLRKAYMGEPRVHFGMMPGRCK